MQLETIAKLVMGKSEASNSGHFPLARVCGIGGIAASHGKPVWHLPQTVARLIPRFRLLQILGANRIVLAILADGVRRTTLQARAAMVAVLVKIDVGARRRSVAQPR